MDTNKVILSGTIVRPPVMRATRVGGQVLELNLKTVEQLPHRTITQFHRIKVWDELADRVNRTYRAGDNILVEGRISNGSYTDKKLNITRYTTEIVADTVQGLDGSVAQAERPEAKTDAVDFDDIPF